MKELSVEQKAKAYDNLIERLKDLKFVYRFSPVSDTIEDVFPELKESEDEKMLAMAIKAVYAPEAQSCIKSWGINPDDVIAWLKKQAEKAKYHDICDKCVRQSTCQSDCFLQQGEQKPTEWSEKDEAIWEEISDMLWEGYQLSCRKFTWDDIRDWIKPKIEYFKERVQPQPKQEWSKDDELTRNALINLVEMYYGGCIDKSEKNKLLNFLKSLRDRYTWKPSKEQLQALKNQCINTKSTETGAFLCDLYYDLKKL